KTGSFCLSIDHLKMGLIRSGNTSLTPYDDEELTGYLWPIVRGMIMTAVENSQDLIVEGCYVPFDWKKDLDETYLSHIRYICLSMTPEYISSHLGQIVSHASDSENRLFPDDDVTADCLIRDNLFFARGCEAYGNELLMIEDDWETSVGSWINNI
ncbi:MAG: adenylate kinase, partial [Oscillospiraceae bacterium]|nr:adenylate kinase [Oscillospiraceae bacterium]